ncbi:hypothetical protein VTJ04DRAFT_8793 [Mycothermus thermophilus]|uniref:uncharacterized protein n=1 Tax=Humicola insolens TaxID=85995 RepID=UPI00374436BD
MAATSRPRPCVDDFIHDDHSHTDHHVSGSQTTTTTLGELPLNSVYGIKPRNTSIDSLALRLDGFHIADKENQPSERDHDVERTSPQSQSTARLVKDDVSDTWEETNPLAQASWQLPSTQEQLAKHQQGQFEWLLSIPVPPRRVASADPDVRRSRGGRADTADGLGDEEGGGETLYFGCNLVCRRRSRSVCAEGQASDDSDDVQDHRDHDDDSHDRPTNVYTLLATRITDADELAMAVDAEMERLESLGDQERLGPAGLLGAPQAPPSVASSEDRSRPVSRIEDSVEALDKLEEEIEALREATEMTRVFSLEAVVKKANKDESSSSKTATTPVRRAASVRAGTTSGSARGKTLERSASVRKGPSAEHNGETSVPGSASSSTRKVPRPTSLLPPKPLAKSNKPTTVPDFELPGDAVARKLKEQREKRMSLQQRLTSTSSEKGQTQSLPEHYTPAKPHFKSPKPPTVPTFELPGEAISRRKREKREAELRAQQEEERRAREFKARPIRASLAAPSTLPRENLASLARRAAVAGEEVGTPAGGSKAGSVGGSTSNKRHSMMAALSSSARASASPSPAPTSSSAQNNKSTTLPIRGRPGTSASMATSTSGGSARSSSQAGSVRHSIISSTTATSLSGKEVMARDNALREERQREKRERENAAKQARKEAAEWSREQSRRWAEKQRMKKEREKERQKEREKEKVEAVAKAVEGDGVVVVEAVEVAGGEA